MRSRRMKNIARKPEERCARLKIFNMCLIFHATTTQATKDFIKIGPITSEVDNALGAPNHLVKKLAMCIGSVTGTDN